MRNTPKKRSCHDLQFNIEQNRQSQVLPFTGFTLLLALAPAPNDRINRFRANARQPGALRA
jgi:hypothetical protein